MAIVKRGFKKTVSGKIRETFEVEKTAKGKKVVGHKIFEEDEKKKKKVTN